MGALTQRTFPRGKGHQKNTHNLYSPPAKPLALQMCPEPGRGLWFHKVSGSGGQSPERLGCGGRCREEAREKPPRESRVPAGSLRSLSPQRCQFSLRGEVGEGAAGNTAKEGAGAGAWADPPPHFPFLAREWGVPRGEGSRGAGGSKLSDTPLFPGSHLPGLRRAVGEEGWGKPELPGGNRPDQKRGSRAEGSRGRIGQGCLWSYLLRCVPAGGDGVPRRTGEALSARFRIPPCFWVRLLQEARVPVGS